MRDAAAQRPNGDSSVPDDSTTTSTTAPTSTSASSTTTTTAAPHHDFLSRAPATPNRVLAPSRGWLSSVRRPKTSPGPKSAAAFRKALLAVDDSRRDSALASSTSSAAEQGALQDRRSPNHSLRRTPSLPAITVQDESAPRSSTRSSQRDGWRDSIQPDEQANFATLDTIIPTGGFDDLTSPSQVSFSKRGSMLLGGKRANTTNMGNRMSGHLARLGEGAPAHKSLSPARAAPAPPAPKEETDPPEAKDKGKEKEKEPQGQPLLSSPATPHLSPSPRSPSGYSTINRRRAASTRILSTDEAMLSKKVRSMYKHGNESAANWDGDEEGGSVQNGAPGSSVTGTPANGSSLLTTVDDTASMRSSRRESVIVKEPTETAGGVEDWTDIDGYEIDRYGFILPKRMGSRDYANAEGLDGPDIPRIQRVTTLLQLASEEPRKRGLGRSVSRATSKRSVKLAGGSFLKRQQSTRSRAQGSVCSNKTSATRRPPQKPFRSATNRLPHNRDRRLLDEASDMLKLPPGLEQLAEQADGGRAAQALKAKEMEREEKWRKMAKVVQSGAKGGGMLFEFDVKDPKVTSRTWKGIPDRWRATAWYAFLAASAKADKNSPTDEELVTSFYELQEESSADDMQIDVDVPRTINRHIMFRRRYRGGQRLLFRVLHAMSLYLPETGYVQGMAALAATLLCYYEEDKAFVMLVRLWQHRGLERLYEKGFTGLMDALEDFEKNWLRGGDVVKKLDEMGITSTAYGTRWYLTLFNYSLPFPAQLRVWDVFMLLGDVSNSVVPNSKFTGDLDVLHATSAALIDATREILLDSDFEIAMKVLTSWIPIKDEDLLMKVAKAEYKMRKKRGNSG